MKRLSNLYSLLAALCVLGLSSCLVNHARVYEHAFECDGVQVDAPDTAYRHKGKEYLKGTRIGVRLTRNSSYQSFAEVIVGPARWEYSKIPGTEGEVVYRELALEKKWQTFREGSTWQVLDISESLGHKIPDATAAATPDIYGMTETRHLTWRGVYALPAAAALLAVELPYNVVSSIVSVFAPH